MVTLQEIAREYTKHFNEVFKRHGDIEIIWIKESASYKVRELVYWASYPSTSDDYTFYFVLSCLRQIAECKDLDVIAFDMLASHEKLKSWISSSEHRVILLEDTVKHSSRYIFEGKLDYYALLQIGYDAEFTHIGNCVLSHLWQEYYGLVQQNAQVREQV